MNNADISAQEARGIEVVIEARHALEELALYGECFDIAERWGGEAYRRYADTFFGEAVRRLNTVRNMLADEETAAAFHGSRLTYLGNLRAAWSKRLAVLPPDDTLMLIESIGNSAEAEAEVARDWLAALAVIDLLKNPVARPEADDVAE